MKKQILLILTFIFSMQLTLAQSIEVLQGDFWKSGKLNRLGNYVLLDASYE